MLRSLQHSLHLKYSLFPKKLKWLFFGHLTRTIADQAIGLFIPLFLFARAQEIAFFNSGPLAGLTELQRGIVLIGAYYFTSHFGELFLVIPLTKLMKQLGLVRSMIVGNLLNIVLYLLLFAAQSHPWALACAAVLDGIVTAMYWIPYYTEFAVQADMKQIGSDVGGMQFMEQLLRAAMPMLGGLLIMSFGFGSSYLTAAFLYLVASIMLLFIPEVKFSYEVTFKELKSWWQKKSFLPTVIGFAGKYVDDSSFLIWPLFIFLFLGNIARVGYVYSIVLFISLIISYFMGWYLGKHRGNKLFFFSGAAIGILWVFRAFIGKVWQLLVVDTTDRLMLTIYTPIFETYFMRKSLGKRVFHFHAYREMVISYFALFFWPIAVGLFMLPFGWTGLFIFASIGVFLSMFMKGKSVDV
ncbi:MAG TPA: MFS transporter [Candidatus Saccharimonadia bacterium]|nr:MFS transporter [Candidatus Saccharimonadia bacterium]